MPIIHSTSSPRFELGDAVFTGLAAPSRGSTENAVWRVRLTSTAPARPHTLDREEVLVAISGRALATLDGTEHLVEAGDAVVIPAGAAFALRCAEDDGHEPGFEAVAILPVGGRACLVGGEPFTPPWAE